MHADDTRSSAVAKRPRDASCLYSFYTLELCGYPMVNKFEHMFIRFDMIHEREKSPFSCTAAHIFVSPGDAPATITQYVAWTERQFNACQSSMYLSIFNSFRVIRCLSQCVSQPCSFSLYYPKRYHPQVCQSMFSMLPVCLNSTLSIT